MTSSHVKRIFTSPGFSAILPYISGNEASLLSNLSIFHERAERLINCKSIESLWQCHVENMATYGFDRLLYMASTLTRPGNWGDPSDRLVLTNYPAPVIDTFIGESLHRRTAKIPTPAEGPGAYSWRKSHLTENAPLNQAERAHLSLCTKWKITAGYTIWFSDMRQRRKGVMGLCARIGLSQADVDRIWLEHGHEIHALCNILHLKALSLPSPDHRNLLTPRQREVLNGVADGLSTQELARKMGLSVGTIEKHLRLARQALNAETTANAIHKASELHQLFLLREAV